MKAAVYEGNHTLRLHEGTIEKPGKGQVRLEIAYCGICGSDLHVLSGSEDARMHLPSVIGHECSAVVAELGEGVDAYAVGDHVVVMPVDACGECQACKAGYQHVCQHLKVRGIETPGAFQYSWTVDADALFKIPETLSLKHAALAEPLSICCHVVKRGQVKAGNYVVVIGGGPIGLMTALVARAEGAHVVVSEVNENRVKKAASFGLEVVNPMQTNVVAYVRAATDDAGADVVFETSGSQPGVDTMVLLPKVHGRVVLVAIYGHPMTVDLKQLYYYEKELTTARMQDPEDFAKAVKLLDEKVFDPDEIITSVLPLTEIQEGFDRAGDRAGHEVKVVIDCHVE